MNLTAKNTKLVQRYVKPLRVFALPGAFAVKSIQPLRVFALPGAFAVKSIIVVNNTN
jgi:hypothetical protein